MSQLFLLLTALLGLASLATCGFLGWRALRRNPWPRPLRRPLSSWPSWLLPAAIVAWLGLSLVAMKPTPTEAADVDAVNGVLVHNALIQAALFLLLVGLVEAARHLAPAGAVSVRDRAVQIAKEIGATVFNFNDEQAARLVEAVDGPQEDDAPPAAPVSRQLLYGVVGFLACLAPTVVVYQLTMPFRTDANLHPLLKLISEDDTHRLLISVAFSAVMVAPWVEELLFRVIMQRTLLRHFSPSTSILLTAIAFCGIHASWQDAVGLAPLALVLGVTYHRTGSFLAVVLIHVLFNAFNILSMLMESLPS